MTARLGEWRDVVTPEERLVYERAGYRSGRPMEGRLGLMVVDATRNFTGTRPLPALEALEEYPTSCGEAAWVALAAIRRLLDAFRAAELPVVFTRRGHPAGGATKRIGGGAREGGNEFVELIAPREDELICEKSRASAFYDTILADVLRRERIDTIVLCGGTTSGCVRATCVDAFSAGFAVVVPEDGVFDRARGPHLANLFDMHAKYATVTAADDVIAVLTALRMRSARPTPA